VGETVEVTTGWVRRTVAVRGLADRRGPASVAATIYVETEESVAARERAAAERRAAQPLLGGRPTKQDRRRLEALRKSMNRRP